MLIIPAIDIKDGKCVRLTQGKFEEVTIYSDDPVNMATIWEKEGGKMIHVVDLDGAKGGIPANLETIKKIVTSVTVPVEVGGGIRTRETIELLLNAGVARVVIGTIALENQDLLKELVIEYGEKIAVALDTKEGKLVSRGWLEESGHDYTKTASELEKSGVRRFIYTDVISDGMMIQPNFDDIEKLLKTVSVPVIASGGVTTVEDIQKLKELGVEGVIIGKAFYEGIMDMKELFVIMGD